MTNAVRRSGWTLALAWLMCALLALPAAAQSGSVAADRYDVDITVADGGALNVVERLSLDFTGGPFRHGYRDIPLDRVEAIRDVQVSEAARAYQAGAERPYTFQTSRQDDALRVDWWFPPTTNATREFEIRYRAEAPCASIPTATRCTGKRSAPITATRSSRRACWFTYRPTSTRTSSSWLPTPSGSG